MNRKTNTKENPRKDQRSAGQPVRIVVVDDHPTMREGLIQLLRAQTDFEVVAEASNGQHAVECVGHLQPDVVIMDVNMPGMDGIQATRIIAERWPKVRVIALSMHDDEAITQQMRDAGAVDYVTKTEPAKTLIKRIRQQAAQETETH